MTTKQLEPWFQWFFSCPWSRFQLHGKVTATECCTCWGDKSLHECVSFYIVLLNVKSWQTLSRGLLHPHLSHKLDIIRSIRTEIVRAFQWWARLCRYVSQWWAMSLESQGWHFFWVTLYVRQNTNSRSLYVRHVRCMFVKIPIDLVRQN